MENNYFLVICKIVYRCSDVSPTLRDEQALQGVRVELFQRLKLFEHGRNMHHNAVSDHISAFFVDHTARQ